MISRSRAEEAVCLYLGKCHEYSRQGSNVSALIIWQPNQASFAHMTYCCCCSFAAYRPPADNIWQEGRVPIFRVQLHCILGRTAVAPGVWCLVYVSLKYTKPHIIYYDTWCTAQAAVVEEMSEWMNERIKNKKNAWFVGFIWTRSVLCTFSEQEINNTDINRRIKNVFLYDNRRKFGGERRVQSPMAKQGGGAVHVVLQGASLSPGKLQW